MTTKILKIISLVLFATTAEAITVYDYSGTRFVTFSTTTGGGSYINNQSTLQSGATFYVSSGTVTTLNIGNVYSGVNAATFGGTSSIPEGYFASSSTAKAPLAFSGGNQPVMGVLDSVGNLAGGFGNQYTFGAVNSGPEGFFFLEAAPKSGSPATYFQGFRGNVDMTDSSDDIWTLPISIGSGFWKSTAGGTLSNYDLLNATQTWTGGNTFSSATITNAIINSCSGAGCGSGGGGSFALNASSQAAITSTATLATSSDFSYTTSGSTITISVTPGGSCWSSSYNYRRTLTVDHTKVSGDQVNFPVLISTTMVALSTITANGGRALNASGFDIVFTTKSDCSAPLLYWDTETYNATTGNMIAWVKAPTLSASVDTTIYMCMGNSSITSYMGVSSNTWDSNFKGVYHFRDGSTLYTNDSTSNGLTLTGSGTPTAATGKADGGIGINGNNQYASSPNTSDFNFSSSGTVGGWVNLTNLTSPQGQGHTIVGKNSQGSDRNGYDFHVMSTGKLFVELSNGGSSIGGQSNGSITAGGWHQVEATWDGYKIYFYLDGAQDITSYNQTLTAVANVYPLVVGRSGEHLYNTLYGTIDEVRMSTTARSSGWIATEYNTMNSPNSFFAMGTESAGSGTSCGTIATVNSSNTFTANQNFSNAILANGSAGTSGQYLKTNGAGAAPSWTTAAGSSSGTVSGMIQGTDGNGTFTSYTGVLISTTENAGANTLDINSTGGNVVIMSHVNGHVFVLDVQNNSTGTANGDLVGSLYISPTATNLFQRNGAPLELDATGDAHWTAGGAAGPIQLRTSDAAQEGTPFTALQVNATQQVLIPAQGTDCDILSGKTCPMTDTSIRLQVNGKVQSYNVTTTTVTVLGVTFSTLGTSAPNGTYQYCSDCTTTTPATCTANLLSSCVCAGSGSGAFAKRLNGAWYCN